MKRFLLSLTVASLVVAPTFAQVHHKHHVVHHVRHHRYLSNSRHYTNAYGHSVHSPAYSSDGGIPAGATAVCEDGTYSFSENHRGTCSHHGGVRRWLR